MLDTSLVTFCPQRNGLVYWWRKPEYLVKITDLSQVTDKLYHIMLYTSPWSSFELTTLVVIGIDCIGSYKSNYHTITTTTAPSVISIIIIPPRYNWNIVKSGVKHHNPNPYSRKYTENKINKWYISLFCIVIDLSHHQEFLAVSITKFYNLNLKITLTF
jgi:hypothetical protein